jgi:hypothetical protein
MASSFLRFLDHTQWRTTVGRTHLDEWSSRRRDLYLTTHNTHNRQTSIPPVGFEPTISEGERPQTYALDRAATKTGNIQPSTRLNILKIPVNKANLVHNFSYYVFSFFYMFRATMCPSSGEITVYMRQPCIPNSHPHRVTNTKCRTDVVISPDDEHIVARNVYRKEINTLRKIVHQVGFIYNIIQGCTVNKTLKKTSQEIDSFAVFPHSV